MTAMYVAAGYQPRTAATEALRIFNAETTTDSNGTRMTPNNYIKGWNRPEVEEIVRKEFLRPYLARRNIDPDAGLWSDVDDRAIIEPQSNGTGLLMVGNTIIGVLPLETWVGLAATRADRVESEGIAVGKAEADAKRFEQQSKGARGLSQLQSNPNTLP